MSTPRPSSPPAGQETTTSIGPTTSANDGPQVNFDFTADGGSDFNLTGPNQLGSGGSGVTHVYNDAGTHYLEISSEGDWTVKVVTTR